MPPVLAYTPKGFRLVSDFGPWGQPVLGLQSPYSDCSQPPFNLYINWSVSVWFWSSAPGTIFFGFHSQFSVWFQPPAPGFIPVSVFSLWVLSSFGLKPGFAHWPWIWYSATRFSPVFAFGLFEPLCSAWFTLLSYVQFSLHPSCSARFQPSVYQDSQVSTFYLLGLAWFQLLACEFCLVSVFGPQVSA